MASKDTVHDQLGRKMQYPTSKNYETLMKELKNISAELRSIVIKSNNEQLKGN